jgi:hypothetical protein
MRYHKKCVRCETSFLGTKSMLVCGHCYGNPEDLAVSQFIQDYRELPVSLKKIQNIVRNMENNTCNTRKNNV